MGINMFNMIAEATMPSQVKKTRDAISKITDLEMCRGCLIHFDRSKMALKPYRNPFTLDINSGYFCEKCQKDESIKFLLL